MIKSFMLLLCFLINIVIYSDQIVNIWADNSPLNLGVSKERVWLKSYFLDNFEYYSTLSTETKVGVPTVVTVSRDLFFLLEDLLKHENTYSKDFITIKKKDKIYTFTDSSIGLDFSFGLEKPSKEVLNMIKSIYKDDLKTQNEVIDHYLESWVIRIYSAENVISPDLNTLDFDDILITATIIGEKFQWLWGVHDGVDYIFDKLR